MRNLKKISAVVLVFAMLFSLVSMSAFAAEPTVKFTLKYNGVADAATAVKKAGLTSLEFDVYFSTVDNRDIDCGTLSYKVQYPDWVKSADFEKNATDYPTVTINKQATPANRLIGCGVVALTGSNKIFADKKLGTLRFDVSDVVADKTEFALTLNAATAKAADLIANETVDTTKGGFVLSLSDALKVTGLKTPISITDKGLDTAQAGLGLPTSVVVTTVKQVGGAAGSDMTLDVTWSGYNPETTEPQTLIGTLTTPDAEGIDVTEVNTNKTITATVTLGKITLDGEMVKSEYANLEVPQEEEGTLTAEAAIAKLGDEYKTATISKDGKFEETNATVAWTGDGSLDLTKLTKTDASNKLTLTGTVTPAADGNYTGTATVTIEVVVVPANIPGGTIKVNNPIENGKAKVTVTVPAAEIAKLTEGAEIVATIAAKNGTDPAATASVALEAEDIAAAKAENPVDYKAVLTVDKSMKTLGYAKDDTFKAYVTVAGTALLNGTGDDAVDYAEGTVVKATSGGGSNFNPGSAPTTPTEPTKPTEPTDPTKPTEPTDPTDPTKPTEPTTPADKFNDVEDSFWAAEDIYLLKEAGIINGKSASEFDPEGKVTRAEFTKMITQLFGVEATSGAAKFEDCGDADWFTPYVAAAVEAGLITGYSDTEFAPDKTITREEACTIIGRGLKAVAEGELTFTDASDVSDFAAEYVAILAAKGFINGYEDGSFLPANEITRAESAKIVANVFKSLKAEAEAEAPVEAETETEAPAEAEAEAPAEAETEAEAEAE